MNNRLTKGKLELNEAEIQIVEQLIFSQVINKVVQYKEL